MTLQFHALADVQSSNIGPNVIVTNDSFLRSKQYPRGKR